MRTDDPRYTVFCSVTQQTRSDTTSGHSTRKEEGSSLFLRSLSVSSLESRNSHEPCENCRLSKLETLRNDIIRRHIAINILILKDVLIFDIVYERLCAYLQPFSRTLRCCEIKKRRPSKKMKFHARYTCCLLSLSTHSTFSAAPSLSSFDWYWCALGCAVERNRALR